MRLFPTIAVLVTVLVSAPTMATSHFDSCSERTGNNATLIIPASVININGSSLQPSDEIAIFTPAGTCAGHLVWDGENAALAVWEDDPMTEETEGFVEGDALTYAMWDVSHSLEYGLGLGEISVTYDGAFESSAVFLPDAVYQAAEINIYSPVDAENATPHLFTLDVNYPNPFSQRTMIQYEIAETSRVTLEVYDLLGHRVGVIVDGTMPAGRHEATFSAGTELASGVYLYRIQAGNFSAHRKMTLIN